jgi:predicted Zn-dependent protease
MQLAVPWDEALEASVARFEEQAASAQVRVQSLHPFDKELFVTTLRQQLASFYTDIQKGYEVLVNTVLDLSEAGVSLAGMEPMHKKSMKSVKHLFPDPEALAAFSDEEKAGAWLEEGKPLYVALGLSDKAIITMYEASFYLLNENRDEDARAAFRLLIVLAPHMSDFWCGYGVCLIRLRQFTDAIDSLERAVSLDSQSVQSLLLLCRALAEANRKAEAEARLGAKLDEAGRKGDRQLYDMLEAARFELSKFSPT